MITQLFKFKPNTEHPLGYYYISYQWLNENFIIGKGQSHYEAIKNCLSHLSITNNHNEQSNFIPQI